MKFSEFSSTEKLLKFPRLSSCHSTTSSNIHEGHPHNQDALVDLPEYGVFAAIDGVSGGKDSHITANFIKSEIEIEFGNLNSKRDRASVCNFIADLCDKVREKNQKEGLVGAATLSLVLLTSEGRANLFNVGDCAVLTLTAEGTLRRNIPFAEGISETESEAPHQIGSYPEAEHVSFREISLGELSGILVATDGVIDNLNMDEIQKILTTKDQDQVLQKIIGAAKRNNFKPDDISAVYVTFPKKDFSAFDKLNRETKTPVYKEPKAVILSEWESSLLSVLSQCFDFGLGKTRVPLPQGVDRPSQDEDALMVANLALNSIRDSSGRKLFDLTVKEYEGQPFLRFEINREAIRSYREDLSSMSLLPKVVVDFIRNIF